MKISLVALAVAFALSLGVATARADQTDQAQDNGAPLTQSAALNAYNANTNAELAVPSTGVYDQADRYVDPQGWPLPGWQSIGGWYQGH